MFSFLCNIFRKCFTVRLAVTMPLLDDWLKLNRYKFDFDVNAIDQSLNNFTY